MCDRPVPCACVLEKRSACRAEHMERSRALERLALRLSRAGQISDAEYELLAREALEVWDDAVHIASADDPLRSLCGSYGRNLVDLPARPDWLSGCWGCLTRADKLEGAAARVATPA